MLVSSINDCSLFEFSKKNIEKHYVVKIINGNDIPFNICRIYYLYDVPVTQRRGGHAHKKLNQLVVAASGSFDIIISDGKIKRTITLSQPFKGLHIVPGIWRELENFSTGSVCLVLASHEYDENDYVREYSDYINWKNVSPWRDDDL